MGPAKLLTALVALGVVVVAGAQSSTPEQCPPCTKILQPVCGADEEDESKTFPNSCILRWCNCMLRNADADRTFKQLHTGNCEGLPSNETDIPECFPEMETTSESADDVSTTRVRIVSTATPTVGPRVIPGTQNASEATTAAGTGLIPRTQNASEAAPAAGARLVPGSLVAVVAVLATLVAGHL